MPLRLTDDDGAKLVESLAAPGRKIGWLPLGETAPPHDTSRIVCLPLPREPAEYARRLYATLHACERSGVAEIVVQRPPTGSAWSAVHDRLSRAAAT